MCIFCKIVNSEIPAYKIYEDNEFIAFLDISQATIGHTLVVVKEHFDNVFTLDEEVAGRMFHLTCRLAKKISSALHVNNMNILNNNGPMAGQTINHFHIHLIPRYENDNMIFQFTHNSLTKDKFIELRDLLKN